MPRPQEKKLSLLLDNPNTPESAFLTLKTISCPIFGYFYEESKLPLQGLCFRTHNDETPTPHWLDNPALLRRKLSKLPTYFLYISNLPCL
jgi:hypothetical protein